MFKVLIGYNDSHGHNNKSHCEREDRVTLAIKNLLLCYPSLFITKKYSKKVGYRMLNLVHKRSHIGLLKQREPTPSVYCGKCNKKSYTLQICSSCNQEMGNDFYYYLNPDTYKTPYTFRAVMSAMCTIKSMLDHMLIVKNHGYLLIRPPGHHSFDKPNGFCFVNNAIIAAKYAQKVGYKRVMILDWDYHHFDGTAPYLCKEIYGVSMHAYGPGFIYPGTGSEEENTENMLNIPFHIKADEDVLEYDDDVYLFHFNEAVIPFIIKKSVDLIIISNGLDAHNQDPLAGLNLTDNFYIEATRKLKELNIPLLYILEGGYNPNVINRVSLAIVEELST
jgi:acetoin utilization deacetylase AcuC-like enzyme